MTQKGCVGVIIAILVSGCMQAAYQPILSQPQDSLRLMTFNILVKRPLIDRNSRAWKERGPLVVELIEQYRPDVIGLQEVTEEQKAYLDCMLAPAGYASVGLKRAPDQKIGFLKGRPGEYALIMYNTRRVKLDWHETVWLNETDQQFKIGWDAKLPRICTAAQCTLLSTQQPFLVCNTHLALEPVAQQHGARRVARLAQEKGITQNMPVVIMGDFNMTEQSVLTEVQSIIPTIMNTKNMAQQVFIAHDEAQGGTRVGWKKLEKAGYVIDHIFAQGIHDVGCYAIPVRSDAKKWRVSDHRPVLVDIMI